MWTRSFSLLLMLSLAACGGGQQTGEVRSVFVPGDEESLLNQAIEQRRAGDIEGAAVSLQNALQANPLYLAAHLELGDLNIERNRLSDAEANFMRAVELRARTPDGHLGMARVTYLLQRYDEALSHAANAVQTAISSGSDWMLADALVTRANIEIALGNLDQASLTLDEALEADTTNVAARIARARIQARRGDISAAVTTMARAESFEENPDRLLEMGILYYDMRVDERAVEALTRGLERAPNDETMLYYLAATRMRSGQRDIAIELASDLIVRNPAMLSAYVIRGRGELLRGYTDRARADVDRVLSQVPTHYDALVLSGDLYVAEGMPTQDAARLDAAEQAYLAAIAVQPEGFEAIDHLADLYYARRNTEAFIALVEPRLRNGMTNPNWRLRMAECYQSVGRIADGIALRSELALAAPSDVDLNMTVARMALDNPGSLSTELVVRHASAAYQHSNRSLEYILLIVDAHLLEGNCEQALNRLETAINAFPTANSVRERQDRIEACD